MPDGWGRRRERMIRDLLLPAGVRDPRVIQAMRRVPRHRLVAPALAARAYGPEPIPIGDGQTLSAPVTVALTLQAIGLRGHERVLEVGTGSGYQAALLCELAGEVFSLERIEALAERARERLEEMGYERLRLGVGDGTVGWPEHGPFDAIVVAAAGPAVPEPLLEQLAPGGHLVVPVGSAASQELLRVRREPATGAFRRESLGPCRFVPLIGQAGHRG